MVYIPPASPRPLPAVVQQTPLPRPVNQQPAPTLRPVNQQPAPTLRPGSQQPAPTLRPGSQQPVPTLRPGSQQPVPTLRPGSQQPVPTLRPGSQQPVPTLRPGSQQPVPTLRPGSQQPAPTLHLGSEPTPTLRPESEQPVGSKRGAQPDFGSPPAKSQKTGYVDHGTVGLVDSGIGGAMAGKLIEGHVEEFGSQVALPIGDKHVNQIETFTAQMVGQSLISDGHEHAIIACNTASCSKEKAIEHLGNFIQREANLPVEQSILRPETRERVLQLNDQIREARADVSAENPEGRNFLSERVHGIVMPTAESAANSAMEAFRENDSYSVLIDSTAGTVKSEAYPRAIDIQMRENGYERAGEPIVTSSEDGAIKKSAYTYTNSQGESKTLAITSRGNPEWVPAIEAGQLADAATQGEGTRADQLVRDSREKSDAVQFNGENQHLNALFAGDPDLNMLCCTHYPAMREALDSSYTADGEDTTQFLQQDEVVRDMVERLKADGEVQVPEQPNDMRVVLGDSNVNPDELPQKEQVIRNVYGDNPKEVAVDKLPEADSDEFKAVHRDMEFNREDLPESERRFSTQGEGQQVLHVKDEQEGTHTAWTQDRQTTDPKKVGGAVFVGGIPTQTALAPDVARSVEESKAFLKDSGLSDTDIRLLFSDASQSARLVASGESRGIGPLSVSANPGAAMFNSATDIAQVIEENRNPPMSDRPISERTNIGIVSGFTVIQNDGVTPMFGENDGPPGAIMLAQTALQNGTPATLIMDKGSESSFFSAAMAAGLVLDDGNGANVSPQERTFDGATLIAGLTIQVVGDENSVEDVKADLNNRGTALVISTERPSPNNDGVMSNMRGQSIDQYNEDLSGFFEFGDQASPWKTIGIGDGGNEIGTGSFRDQTINAKKPDFTPVVNNGEKIAARVATDETIPASVSNNGALFLSALVEQIDTAITTKRGDPEPDAGHLTTKREFVEQYKSIIDGMHAEGMSLDGVNKVNAQTVDGRTLHRPEGQAPAQLGTPEATHDDMFDQFVDIGRERAPQGDLQDVLNQIAQA